jgi:rhamnosyl/mannosyltransferase
MKILFFDEFDLRNFGGKEKVIIEISKELAKTNEVKIISTDALKFERIKDKELLEILEGVEYKRMNTIKLFKHSIFLNPIDVYNFVKWSDVIYCTSPDFFSNLPILFFSKILKKKVVLGFHDPDIFVTSSKLKKLKRFFDFLLFNSFDAFHLLTKVQIEKLKSYNNKKFLIPNFYDKNLEKIFPKEQKEFVVIFIGRLTKQKGAELIPNIAKSFEEIKFVVLGEGEEREEIERRIKEEKIENVSLLGFVSEKEKIEQLRKASLLIFPSRFETFPLVIVDALACGLPFVAFSIPEIKELSNKQNSYLAKDFDVEDFKKGIKLFYEKWKKDKKGYLNLRRKIKEQAKVFSISRVSKDYEKMFKEVIK